jgi:hypothetical protein
MDNPPVGTAKRNVCIVVIIRLREINCPGSRAVCGYDSAGTCVRSRAELPKTVSGSGAVAPGGALSATTAIIFLKRDCDHIRRHHPHAMQRRWDILESVQDALLDRNCRRFLTACRRRRRARRFVVRPSCASREQSGPREIGSGRRPARRSQLHVHTRRMRADVDAVRSKVDQQLRASAQRLHADRTMEQRIAQLFECRAPVTVDDARLTLPEE